MNTVTISKKEYQNLVSVKFRYELLRDALKRDVFDSPPLKNIAHIMEMFKNAKRHNAGFLRDLKKGLRRSSFFHE